MDTNAPALEDGVLQGDFTITGLREGLIFNFKRAKLEWERVAL